MKDFAYLGLAITAQRSHYSSDLKISTYQLTPMTEIEVKKMTSEFRDQDISNVFVKYKTCSEDELRALLRFTQNACPENFNKAFDMVMSYADVDIAEKLLSLQQQGKIDEWITGELREECDKLDTSLAFDDLEILESLLNQLDDVVLKELVISKFKASLQSLEASK